MADQHRSPNPIQAKAKIGNVPNAGDQEIRSYNSRHAVALDEQAGT